MLVMETRITTITLDKKHCIGWLPDYMVGHDKKRVFRVKGEDWLYLLMIDGVTLGTSPLKNNSTVRTLSR